MTLLYLSLSFVTGIYAGSAYPIPYDLIQGLTMVAAVFAAATVFLLRRRASQCVPQPIQAWASPLSLFLLCLLAMLLGAWRYQAAKPGIGPTDAANYVGVGQLRLNGLVTDDPDVRDTYTNLRVEVTRLEVGGRWLPVTGLVQVTVPRYPVVRYGDFLEITGRLEDAPVFEDFSYRDYLARQGVYAVMRHPRVTIVARHQGNIALSLIYALKQRAKEVIAAALTEPHAGLLMGILLGVKTALPKDLSRDLQMVGLTHIVVVSGFNLTIIAGAIQRALGKWLGPMGTFWASLAGIIAFTVMVGGSAAVVRAAIMVSLALLASTLGRQNDALNALGLAAAAMVAVSPTQLWDVGFQLSVAATAGLILISPLLEGWLRFLPDLLRPNLAVALAAQLATMPIILVNFQRVSLISPLANLAVLWAIPWLMLCGALVIGIGFFWTEGAFFAGWAAWVVSTYVVEAVHRLAAIPWASVAVPHLDWYVPLAYYLAIGAILGMQGQGASLRETAANLSHKAAKHWRPLLAGLALAVILLWTAIATLPSGLYHVYFLDVGQGDAILIRMPDGGKILVDGGPNPALLSAALGRLLPFWDRDIDLLVLTHPHDDHVLGQVEVLQRYRVQQVLEAGIPSGGPGYREWLRLVQEKGIPHRLAMAGQRIDLDHGGRLEVLHPTQPFLTGTNSDANNNSVVLRLVIGQVALLLPGDLEKAGQEALLGRYGQMAATVLKVPHHGAAGALDDEFLRAVRPVITVISVGENNFGHPAKETLEQLRGTQIYRTDERGTIEVITDGTGCEVRTER